MRFALGIALLVIGLVLAVFSKDFAWLNARLQRSVFNFDVEGQEGATRAIAVAVGVCLAAFGVLVLLDVVGVDDLGK